MRSEIEKLPKKTYKIKITVPKEDVDEAFIHSLKHFAEHTTIEGFRQGKAPLELVKQKIDKRMMDSEVINHLVPEFYSQIINEHHLHPISSPKIEIETLEEGKDFIFHTSVVEKPDINLRSYKEEIKKLNKEKPTVEDLLNKIISISNVEVSDILIEEEVSRMLSNLIDQTSRLGITIENYLKSQNKTIEVLREEYRKSAEFNIQAEFLLMEIAKEENISITEEEIQKTINAAPDEKSKKALSADSQKWYIKSVLLKNKVIQYLINLAFGEKSKTDE